MKVTCYQSPLRIKFKIKIPNRQVLEIDREQKLYARRYKKKGLVSKIENFEPVKQNENIFKEGINIFYLILMEPMTEHDSATQPWRGRMFPITLHRHIRWFVV